MDRLIHEQAEGIADALTTLIRRFSAIDTEGPAADLPIAQLRVCGLLSSGPRAMSVLRDDLGISLSAVTQIADRLEKSSLVERLVEPDDHRIKCLQLTELGRHVVRDRRARRVQRVADVLRQLPPDERELAAGGVRTLVDAIAKLDKPASG